MVGESDLLDLLPGPPGGLKGVDDAIRSAAPGPIVRGARGPASCAAPRPSSAAPALVGSLLTTPDSRWYRSLDLPSWQPPNWAFPVVWTTLYATTTIASTATIAELREAEMDNEATAFERALVANMVLNAGWSGLFFRGHRPRLAAAECAVLTASSADLARRAAPTERSAEGSLVHTLLGAVSTALTAAIARRNPEPKD